MSDVLSKEVNVGANTPPTEKWGEIFYRPDPSPPGPGEHDNASSPKATDSVAFFDPEPRGYRPELRALEKRTQDLTIRLLEAIQWASQAQSQRYVARWAERRGATDQLTRLLRELSSVASID